MKQAHFILILCVVVAIFFPISFSSTQACTIWAATGERVKGRGSIIAKNRDNVSNLYTALKSVTPEKGFTFLGIFDIRADGYVTAGINEKSLVVVNASANSVPRKKRRVATEDLTERLLTSFDSVQAVLSEKDLFQKSHPAIYIIGDASKIASVEVAPGGKMAVVIREGNGTLALTNHYTHRKLLRANEQLSVNSLKRLKRINYLMKNHPFPFTVDDFIAFGNDKNGGQDGALWRDPNLPDKIRTLASLVVYVPVKGSPELSVKLLNPDEPENVQRMTLDNSFWEQSKTNNSRPASN
jgi:hypothetical protein